MSGVTHMGKEITEGEKGTMGLSTGRPTAKQDMLTYSLENQGMLH